MKEVDYRNGEKVTFGCIIGNIILSGLKLAAGIYGNSKAMVADALHSTSDILATTVVLIGIKIAKKPIDRNHPYGHGKIEPITAAFVGITLFFAAVMIIKNIVISVIDHSFTTPTFLALSAALLSIVVKEAMYRITYAAGKKINSQSIMADALHHRSDAYSSIGTLFGISGSIIGKWLGIGFLGYLDPLAGAIVACLIIKIAFDIMKDAIRMLMDSAPENETISEIIETVSDINGILSVPKIKGRYVGQHLFIDMEITVDPLITVEDGHDIASLTRNKILEKENDVFDVLIHVEPWINK